MSQENNFIPKLDSYKEITPFKLFVKSNFPFIEATYEALDNYGLYCKIVEYLNNVIANENAVENNVTALYNAFVELNTYVSNYLDNYNFQEEVNKKLDELTESGYFESLITDYLKLIRVYNTCEEMKEDYENIANGQRILTLGYYEANDGGGSSYIVKSSTPSTFYETLTDNLYAEMIKTSDSINVKQFGTYGDNEHDDINAINNAIAFVKAFKIKNLYFQKASYLVSDCIILPSNCCIDCCFSDFHITENYSKAKLFINEENGKNITLKNLKVDWNNISLGNEGNVPRGVIVFDRASNIIIEKIYIKNQFETALSQNGENVPIYIQSCNNVSISNSDLIHYGSNVTEKGNGIWLFSKFADCENIEIYNNYLEGIGDELISIFARGYDYIIKNVNIYNNTLVSFNRQGIYLESSSNTNTYGVENVTIKNNIFKGAQIYLDHKNKNIKIQYNEFYDNHSDDYQQSSASYINCFAPAGVSGYKADILIDSNIFELSGTNRNAININNYLRNTTISNNKITSTQKNADNFGITTQGSDQIIENNYVENFENGIRCFDAITRGNTIKNCTNGINATSNFCRIINNLIHSCTFGIIMNFWGSSEISYILNNEFCAITDHALYYPTKTRSGIKTIIKDNYDYLPSGLESRNFMKMQDNTNTKAFAMISNYIYVYSTYIWVENNDVD